MQLAAFVQRVNDPHGKWKFVSNLACPFQESRNKFSIRCHSHMDRMRKGDPHRFILEAGCCIEIMCMFLGAIVYCCLPSL